MGAGEGLAIASDIATKFPALPLADDYASVSTGHKWSPTACSIHWQQYLFQSIKNLSINLPNNV